MKIVAQTNIWDKIAQFYIDAKNEAHKHDYGWDEVLRDIDLAYFDTNFSPCQAIREDWVRMGYQTVMSKRGWVFAYVIKSNIMYICDVEKNKNINNLANSSNTNLSLLKQLNSVKPKQEQTYLSLGYGWWAERGKNGYVYIKDRNGNIMPNIRFNEIISKFRKRKDDDNIYAVGQYGGKNYKFYPNGRCIMIENRNVLRLTEYQFKTFLTECITKILKGIA